MKKFLYFQSIVQYRIPINEDGSSGIPEVLKKFTSPIFGTQKQNKRRPKKIELEATEVDEIEI